MDDSNPINNLPKSYIQLFENVVFSENCFSIIFFLSHITFDASIQRVEKICLKNMNKILRIKTEKQENTSILVNVSIFLFFNFNKKKVFFTFTVMAVNIILQIKMVVRFL